MQAFELRPDSPIGPYRIERLLARGGMGRIYVARREDQEQPVVLKLLQEDRAEDPEFRSMFLHEARLGELLDHPSIARIVDAGELDGHPYMAVEYVDGPPMSEVMARLGSVARGEALGIVCEVAAALEHAHDAKGADGAPLHIVHRDVTPQNILLTRTGYVKLIDFGVAKSRSQDHRTRTGVLKGKLSYMAPEQFRGQVSSRSDIFSLGVILWELLTARRLFRRPTDAEVLSAILVDPVPALDLGDDHANELLQPIVDRALARDPQERYATSGELELDLRRAISRLALSCSPADLATLVSRHDEAPPPERHARVKGAAAGTQASDWMEISVELVTESSTTTPVTPSVVRRRTDQAADAQADGGDDGTSDDEASPEAATAPAHASADEPTAPVHTAGAAASRPADAASDSPDRSGPGDRRRRGAIAIAVAAAALLTAGAWWALSGSDDAEPAEAQQPESAATETAEPPSADEPSPRGGDETGERSAGADDETTDETDTESDRPRRSAAQGRAAAQRRAARARDEGTAGRPQATASGQLFVDTDPWTTVRVGGRSLGQTPVVGADLPAGRHTLELTEHNGRTHRVPVQITANQATKKFLRLD